MNPAWSLVHNELKQNCAIRINDRTFHRSIHKVFSDDMFWKMRGWCSVYCGAENWPHSCFFTQCCDCDPVFCRCNDLFIQPCPVCRGIVVSIDDQVYIRGDCVICFEHTSSQRPLRPCGHALCQECATKMHFINEQ
jgi:hypothetical protein